MRNPVAAIAESSDATGLAFAVGFYFSFRIILVLLTVRLLGSDPRTGSEITLVSDLLLLLLVCFCCVGHANRSFRSMLQVPSVLWVLLFLGLSCCSLGWSETVSMQASAAYWTGMAVDVGIVVLLLRSGSVAAVSHSLIKGFLWSACCLAVVAWIMPAQADLRLGDEDFFNTNQIGNLCAVAIFLAQYLMRRKEGRWGLAILLLSLTLLRSLSKTTIVAFLLSESFLIIQDRSMSRKTKVLLTVGAILTILAFWGLFEAYYDIYTTAGNQAETLTGRTAIWTYVLNAAVEQPWIGHGFDSMWKVIPPFGSDQFEARHAENELLQQFYAYGIIGIAMLIALYGSLYRQIRRLPRGPVKVVFRSILLFVVVRGLAEAEPFDLLLPLWLIVLISSLVEDAMPRNEDAMPALSGVQKEPPGARQRLATQE
jgi:exopolysaccharide production protein ExoQ